MPEDLKDIDARLHALQQFLKQVRWSLPPPLAHHTTARALRSGCRPSRSRAWVDSKWLVCVRRLHSMSRRQPLRRGRCTGTARALLLLVPAPSFTTLHHTHAQTGETGHALTIYTKHHTRIEGQVIADTGMEGQLIADWSTTPRWPPSARRERILTAKGGGGYLEHRRLVVIQRLITNSSLLAL